MPEEIPTAIQSPFIIARLTAEARGERKAVTVVVEEYPSKVHAASTFIVFVNGGMMGAGSEFERKRDMVPNLLVAMERAQEEILNILLSD